MWTGGFGGVQSFNGDAVVGSADARTSAAGGAMGFDYQPTRRGSLALRWEAASRTLRCRIACGGQPNGHKIV